MRIMRKTAIATAFSLLLSIVYPLATLADVVPKVYDGYNYTIKEVVTVTNDSDDPMENLYQTIMFDNRSNSPYQQNLGITYTIDTPGVQEVKNNDTKDTFSRDIKIGTLKPHQQISYTTYRTLYNGKIDYTISPNEFNNYKYDTEKFQDYLKPENMIESDDPLIIQKTKEVVGNETNPYEKARKIFAFVNTYIKYDDSEANTGALNALKTGKGVCQEYASLFIAMCRAAGIPARTVNGIWVNDNGNNDVYYKLNGIFHEWAEIYLPNSWMIVEPTEEYDNREQPSWDTFLKDQYGSHFIGGYEDNVDSNITSYEFDGETRMFFWSSNLKVDKQLYMEKTVSSISQITNFMNQAKNMDFSNYSNLKQLVSALPDSNLKESYNKEFSQLDLLQKCFSGNPTQDDIDNVLKNIDLFDKKNEILSKLQTVQINVDRRNLTSILNDKVNITFTSKTNMENEYAFGIHNTNGMSNLIIYYNGIVKVDKVPDDKYPAIKIKGRTEDRVITIRFTDSGTSIHVGK